MKKIYFAAIAAFFTTSVFAQTLQTVTDSGNSTTNVIRSTGNSFYPTSGIGTTIEYAPTYTLFGETGYGAIQVRDNAIVGTSAYKNLTINGKNIRLAAVAGNVILDAANSNLLIGKSSQVNTAYRLDVAGPIRANDVVVNTSGADFVFEDNYKLMPLEEVEKFIIANKHLPEIPSAKAMQENGLNLSEGTTKLLQKVEELTLYIIELKKENQIIKAELQQLKK